MTVPQIMALFATPVAIWLIVAVLRRLARPHALMYAEISARCADIRARDAEQAVVYDQTPVSTHPGDGSTEAGAVTPDPAPASVPKRVHIEMGGRGRHREAA